MAAFQCQHALDYITHMDSRDYQALADLLSESFTHRFLPASLNGLGIPSRNKRQFFDLLKDLEATFQRFNFQPPQEIIQSQDKVVLHLVSDGKTTSGKTYNNEYVFTFQFEGDKIVSVKEFLDSKYVIDVLEEEKNAASAL